ncbi:hypothetical protein JCM11251_004663 [Rhodosporidiobolus azoricus]
MSAFIGGGLSFASTPSPSMTSSGKSGSTSSQGQGSPLGKGAARKRRPTVSGASYSAPDVPQLTPAERGESPRDEKHYPPPPTPGLGPIVHSPFGILAGSPVNGPPPPGGGLPAPGGGVSPHSSHHPSLSHHVSPHNTPLMPMTPMHSTPTSTSSASTSTTSSGSPSLPPSASASNHGGGAGGGYTDRGAPLTKTPSRLSIASTSSGTSSHSHGANSFYAHLNSGSVSRASSVKSTSSVQAVPMRKPQRGPAASHARGGAARNVPRIVTRGINALGAYGVGVASPTKGDVPLPDMAGVKGKGKAEDGVGERPGMGTQGRSSWRGRFGSSSSASGGGGATGAKDAYSPPLLTAHSSGLPSPVDEGQTSSAASSPARAAFPSAPGEEEGWRVQGRRVDSPARRERGREDSVGSWTRPTYGRADSSKREDMPRFRQREASTVSTSTATASPSSPSIASSPRLPPAGFGSPRPGSTSSASVAGPSASPARPPGRQRELSTTSSAGGSTSASAREAIANAMGVVGTRRSTEDFVFGEVLGEGSYSTVTHVTTVHPPYKHYALKVLDKEHIKREKKTKYVLIERDTLKALDGHPGVIKLWWTFQDEWSLYYVLDLAENGELLKWVKRYGSFDLRSARYYTAQILSAVGFMHEKGIIHRDLKPENILLDKTMRVKITDFGTAKVLKKEEIVDGKPAPPADEPGGRPRARSFVGTPEYVSPEILMEGKESSFSSDFWALGCILFQLLAGRPPFQARTEYLMFQKIIKLEYEFPLGFPPVAKDLVEKLLVLDPAQRLGGDAKNGNGIEAVMGHAFFTEVIVPREAAGEKIGEEDAEKDAEASTPETESAPSSFDEDASTSAGTAKSTPASSVVVSKGEGDLASSTSRLSIASPAGIEKPLPAAPSAFIFSSALSDSSISAFTASSSSPDPLDGPIDWYTIWTVPPPQIHTGLVQPTPVIRGEFVLLEYTPSTIGDRSRWGGSDDGDGIGYEDDVVTHAGGTRDRCGSDDDDADETASSPTSASGRDLPLASTFGAGKWSNILLPSETILLTSAVLHRSSTAAARTAILRGPTKLKSLNPRNLISSSASSGASSAAMSAATSSSGSTVTPGTTPTMGSIPLPTLAHSTNPSAVSASTLASSTPPAPPPAGAKPRTLILTDYPRLLCLKESPHKITVKSEVFLGSALRGGVRREGVSAFICVEPAGREGKGFVVKTSSRNYKFDEPSGQATRWISELREAHSLGLMGPKQR